MENDPPDLTVNLVKLHPALIQRAGGLQCIFQGNATEMTGEGIPLRVTDELNQSLFTSIDVACLLCRDNYFKYSSILFSGGFDCRVFAFFDCDLSCDSVIVGHLLSPGSGSSFPE
jgi:hypothetical protein